MMNSKFATRALLSIVVVLSMCCTMMLGTTLAWFTDAEVAPTNTIETGNLDVVLEYKTDWADQWAPVTDKTKLFKENALYEPGYTEVVFLRVANAGNLALKYKLDVTVADETSSTNKDGKEFFLSDYLEAGVYSQDEYVSGFNYADILMPVMFGTRDAALQNAKNFSKISAEDIVSIDDAPLLVGEQTSQVIALVLTMPTTVGNEANHETDVAAPTIELGVTLVATQYTDENDSFDNQYDADAEYPINVYSADAAYNSFSGFDQSGKSGVVVLTEDYSTADAEKHWSSNREYALRAAGTDVTLDMNGKKIAHNTTYQNGSNTGYTYLFTTAYNGKLTVCGAGEIYSENEAGNTCIFYAQGPSEITINDGKYHAVRGVPVWAGNNAVVNIYGGSFTSSGSNNEELVYSSGGIINIYDGFFHNTGWEDRPVNVADANRGTGFINIYGGTFVNFDPSTGGNDPNNIKVMDGYKVVSETQANGDIWYTVVAE